MSVRTRDISDLFWLEHTESATNRYHEDFQEEPDRVTGKVARSVARCTVSGDRYSHGPDIEIKNGSQTLLVQISGWTV